MAAGAGNPIGLRELDHVVFRVRDIEASLAFYQDVLGLTLANHNEAIQLWQLRCGTGMIDLMPRAGDEPLPEPGRRHVDHVCIGVTGKNIHAIVDYLKSKGVEVIGEPTPRVGARGTGLSVYIADPDGTILEIKQEPDAR
jgi:catechol 2,3-dioxygenase-like lactoylglutathione lyase family enzyme